MQKKLTFETKSDLAKFTLVERGEGQLPTLRGYAIVFSQLSSDRGGYKVRILPGSILYPPDEPVLALYDHDSGKVLGSTANGTLRTSEDNYGVKVEIDPPDTTFGRDAVELVRKGYVRGMSFGTYPEEVNPVTEAGQRIQEYVKHRVEEFTITSRPAFKETSIGAAFAMMPDSENKTVVQAAQQCISACDECIAKHQDNQDMAVCVAVCELCKIACQDVCDSPEDEDCFRDCTTACECCGELLAEIDDDTCRACVIACAACGELCEPEEDGEFARHMTHANGISINTAGIENAKALIAHGKIDNGEWSWTGADEDAALGQNDWNQYARWFMAVDKNASPDTKGHFKYPFGKSGNVFRRAVAAIKSRATAQGADNVSAAAGEIWDALNPELTKASRIVENLKLDD